MALKSSLKFVVVSSTTQFHRVKKILMLIPHKFINRELDYYRKLWCSWLLLASSHPKCSVISGNKRFRSTQEIGTISSFVWSKLVSTWTLSLHKNPFFNDVKYFCRCCNMVSCLSVELIFTWKFMDFKSKTTPYAPNWSSCKCQHIKVFRWRKWSSSRLLGVLWSR